MTYTNIIKFETRKRNTYVFDGNTSNPELFIVV